ncbi:MAG: hypothetical protein ABSH03_02495 [Candidatus Lustribacter sp.]|jgi:hypothetical protein
MKKSVALSCVVIALASIVAGCGANGNVATSASTPAPTPSASCTPPAGYTIQQVFPQNGQGGQPNLEGVVFDVGPSPQPGGVPSPLPSNWFFYVTYNVTTNPASAISSYPISIGFLATPVPVPGSTAGSTPTPLPVPSDAPTNPAFTNYLQETASNGTFANSAASNSQFTVYLANSNCYPGIPESTFSTAPVDLPSPSPTPTST